MTEPPLDTMLFLDPTSLALNIRIVSDRLEDDYSPYHPDQVATLLDKLKKRDVSDG